MTDGMEESVIQRLIATASTERREATSAQVAALQALGDKIDSLRAAMVYVQLITVALLIAAIMARDGVFVRLGIPGATVSTSGGQDER